MEFRLARPSDLPQLEAVYRQVVARLLQTGIPIWDETYPICVFPQDIARQELYVLLDGDTLVSAFSLSPHQDWEDQVPWLVDTRRPYYLSRLAVNVAWLRRGIGSAMLRRAVETARELGGQSLRFFAIDFNAPALALYDKLGFRPTGGVYLQDMGDGRICRELAFEREITP